MRLYMYIGTEFFAILLGYCPYCVWYGDSQRMLRVYFQTCERTCDFVFLCWSRAGNREDIWGHDHVKMQHHSEWDKHLEVNTSFHFSWVWWEVRHHGKCASCENIFWCSLVTVRWNYINKSRRPSRWRKSKTWRSPSSPQIHQKYIYMWKNSAEHLLNVGRRPQTSQKTRNYPHTWVGQKKKEKTETKE